MTMMRPGRTMRTIDRFPRWLLAGVLWALLSSMPPVSPAEAAESQTLRYQIELAGVQVGRIKVAAEDGDETVHARVGWAMEGFLGMLEEGQGKLEGQGRVTPEAVLPTVFKGKFEKSDRQREVRIRYGADGTIEDIRLKSNGRTRQSEVPDELRQDTVDTLTAFWRLRRWLAQEPLIATSIQVFDGRRRYDLHARPLERERVEHDGHEVEAERVELRLVPRAGFDDDARVFGSPVDPDKPWAELLVSLGAEPIPLRATGLGRLPWQITLEED